MKMYAYVDFKEGLEKGALQQNSFMRDMNDLGIITVDEAWLMEQYNDDKKSPVGCTHYYLLHNLREIRNFRKLMKSPKYSGIKEIKWGLSFFNGNDEFQKWLTKKRRGDHESVKV